MAEVAGGMKPDRCTQWHRLGNAVVIRAVQDYRSLQRRKQRQPQNKEIQKELERIEKFFCTNQFGLYSDLDGRELLRTLSMESGGVKRRRVCMQS